MLMQPQVGSDGLTRAIGEHALDMAAGLASTTWDELHQIQLGTALQREALTVTRHGDFLPEAVSPRLLTARSSPPPQTPSGRLYVSLWSDRWGLNSREGYGPCHRTGYGFGLLIGKLMKAFEASVLCRSPHHTSLDF
jgi:hypothetical protein